MVADITPEHDLKLQALLQLLAGKIEKPINSGNRKALIFSAFSDTANYLYENVSAFIKRKYGLDTAMITGSVEGKTTIPKFRATLNNVLTCFSPVSKDKALLMPETEWQRNYFEHIICDYDEYRLIVEYIINNPCNWERDNEEELIHG
ncbi:MAG: hypothetical protein LBJ14_00850 [Desulfarculales bacterium]|jgi:REP element-mobilizing transposase RayT|nr:hypothetical protein [Desulfarculales bacterium]